MSVIGIGHDVCDASRIARTLARFGERFTHRIFTPVERQKCDRRLRRADSYARRFAAKEACSKALGTGFRKGVFWRDLGVVNMPSGKPTMRLTGGAARRLDDITPRGMTAQIDLTISDDDPTAQAIVLISAVPSSK